MTDKSVAVKLSFSISLSFSFTLSASLSLADCTVDGGGIERRKCTLGCQAETLLRLKQTDAHSLSPTHTDARTHPRIPQPRPDPPEVNREEERDEREI